MRNVCLYFQVHQPFRLKKYNIFNAKYDQNYFDEIQNKEIMQKIASRCYLPANKILLNLIKENYGNFKVAFSISGTALEQFEKYAPEVIASFRSLAMTGNVEFLAETYYHSMSALFSEDDFKYQVTKHRNKVFELFNYYPMTFRNTELIYDNGIAEMVKTMGFETVLAEGIESVLGWRSPNYVYQAPSDNAAKLLLRNRRLSDEIAYRFTNIGWQKDALDARTFAKWLFHSKGDIVNLFMDYETFGEHYWEGTGIFEFMHELPELIIASKRASFMLPREITDKYSACDTLNIDKPISWADQSGDISAWLGNTMQQDAANAIYGLHNDIMNSQDANLIADWHKLTTSDHLYYISTKQSWDGMVHRYFSPYHSPYDAYINLMNVLDNLKSRIAAGKRYKQEEYKVLTAS